MNKMCKNPELFRLLIKCSNPKGNVKILLCFCRGYQGDAKIWIYLQKYGITAAINVSTDKAGITIYYWSYIDLRVLCNQYP